MTVVFWVGTDVLEDQRASSGDDEDLQHEIVEGLEEDCAETLCLNRFPVVVSKEFSPCHECVPSDTGI